MNMMNVLFVCFIFSFTITGSSWSLSGPSRHEVVLKDHEHFVIKFDEQGHGNTKVSISEPEPSESETGTSCLYETCPHKLANMLRRTKNAVSEVANDFYKFEERAKDVIDNAVGKIGEPKATLSEKVTESVASIGEQAVTAVRKTIGLVGMGDSCEGTLKDSAVKMEEWDLIDSPKRIGEDIERNASRKIEQGVEEVKETVEFIKETPPKELLERSESKIHDIFFVMLYTIKSVIGWCHLFGFLTAYGMGVWVTFFSSSVMAKCLPKQQFGMVLNKINMVYFRGMAYCVGAAVLGFFVSQGSKGSFLNKMVMFQGFNLLSALAMILINIHVEPRAAKLLVERTKETRDTKRVAAKKLKKLNAYSSTLNMSTMVVLTWHLAYIGQLLQARH